MSSVLENSNLTYSQGANNRLYSSKQNKITGEKKMIFEIHMIYTFMINSIMNRTKINTIDGNTGSLWKFWRCKYCAQFYYRLPIQSLYSVLFILYFEIR